MNCSIATGSDCDQLLHYRPESSVYAVEDSDQSGIDVKVQLLRVSRLAERSRMLGLMQSQLKQQHTFKLGVMWFLPKAVRMVPLVCGAKS